MQVILDGEVCAWDSGSQCYLPFGNNANVRNKEKEAWLAARGVSAGVCVLCIWYSVVLYCVFMVMSVLDGVTQMEL